MQSVLGKGFISTAFIPLNTPYSSNTLAPNTSKIILGTLEIYLEYYQWILIFGIKYFQYVPRA